MRLLSFRNAAAAPQSYKNFLLDNWYKHQHIKMADMDAIVQEARRREGIISRNEDGVLFESDEALTMFLIKWS